jgi:hypothetical protein
MIRPEDLPDDILRGGGASLLPVPLMRAEGGKASPSLRPELEFVFRTLVELRVDMDDLRREFEAYRGEAAVGLGTHVGRVGPGIEVGAYPADEIDEPLYTVDDADPALEDDDRVVVFAPGMTMEDMERQAIRAALAEVRGNRRKAADLLGIGERTLYRKIAKYGLDD